MYIYDMHRMALMSIYIFMTGKRIHSAAKLQPKGKTIITIDEHSAA